MSSSLEIAITPEADLTLDQLLATIRQLEGPALNQVAKALAETQRKAQRARWLVELNDQPSSGFDKNADLETEIRMALQLSG